MNQRTPTEDDWRGTVLEMLWEYFCHGTHSTELGLDGESAYREFFGKTHDEAVQIFRDCGESRICDLYWMPTKCFKFYVRACVDSFRTRSNEELSPDKVSLEQFIRIVENRMHELTPKDLDLKRSLVEFIDWSKRDIF